MFGCRWNSAPPLARLGPGEAVVVWMAVGIGIALLVHSHSSVPVWAGVGGIVAWGAALSNLSDFLRRGAVLDFMLVWPRTRGNLADLGLVAGLAVLLMGLMA